MDSTETETGSDARPEPGARLEVDEVVGFRARKSIKVAPGIRLNVSRSGIGASAGVRGARHSVHSSGRRTTMIGDPIFGVGYMKQTGGGKRRGSRSRSGAQATRPPQPDERPVKPGLFAPKGEKRLYKALKANDVDAIVRVGEDFPPWRVAAYSIAGYLLSEDQPERAATLLALVLDSGNDPASDPFIRKYLRTKATLDIAPGIEAELPLDRDTVGLLLAELRQEAGDLQAAVSAVEQLEPTTYSAVSLAELYTQLGRHEDVIELTEGLKNEDDATALLLVYRAVALRESGFLDGSLEAFKESLRSRSRGEAIRKLALSERAITYLAQNKKVMARKDLERILAEDFGYEGVRERLAELSDG